MLFRSGPASGERGLAQPALAQLLPASVNLVHRKGDDWSEKSFKIDRSPLHATVTSGENWLAVSVSGGTLVLSVKGGEASSLPPDLYSGTLLVTSNREEARVPVTLRVLPAPAPVKTADPTPPVTVPVKPAPAAALPAASNPEPAKPVAAPTAPFTPKTYSGLNRGTARWSGTLAPGAQLVLGESGVLEGGGTVTGNQIPPIEVQVASTFPPGLGVQVLPPGSAQRVVVTNSSGRVLNQIQVNWSKKP